MSSDDVVFSLNGLAAGYGRNAVVADVSLRIRAGEHWVFAGPNGSGKSTLLLTLLGVLAPLAGTLAVHPGFRNGRRTGYVPQRADVAESLPTTLREFVSLGLALDRLTARTRRERVDSMLAQTGLDNLARHPFQALSGGQKQRALLARALVRHPGLLAVDEPTSGLDADARDTFLRILDEGGSWTGQPLTVILVSHETSLIRREKSIVAHFGGGRVRSGPAPAGLPGEREPFSTHAPRSGEATTCKETHVY